MKISLYGFGSFNTSIAAHLDRKYKGSDYEMMFWDRDLAVREFFRKNGSHPHHFPEIKFSENVKVIDSIEELVENAENVIVGVRAQAVREGVQRFAPYLEEGAIVTVVSKGLEEGTNKRMSEVLEEELNRVGKDNNVAVFSGGTLARDVAYGVPLIAEVASKDQMSREHVADVFHSDNLRVYTNSDVLSVELAGALKNVVSLGAGVCEGLGFGTGTRASFVTRACYDIYKLAKSMGASDETFLPGSASFWGDIMLSSFGDTRNREYGRKICESKSTPLEVLKGMEAEYKTVEGFWTVKAAYSLAREHGIDAPCIEQIYKIVHENLDPKVSLSELMRRVRKSID